MLAQASLLTLLNEVLGQTARIRKGGTQATYFCKCGHYKRKLEVLLEPPYFFHCWVRHSSGNVYTLLKEYNASSSHYDRLYPLIDYTKPYKPSKPTNKEALQLPDDFISLADPPKHDAHYSEHMQEYRRAMAYLKNRGITQEDICRYNIGYCEAGEYQYCIVIPSYNDEGKLNYFSSRYYYPHKWLKYKNAPFSKDIVGFESFINYDEPVTLVEGVFDAIAVRNNAVPLFGTMLSLRLREQLIIHKVQRVNLVLDNDAMREAIRAVKELWKWGIKVHLVKLPEKDPSELGFHGVRSLIERSRPFEFSDMVYAKIME